MDSNTRRRGQANAISLMILVAATLAVAIALYGYFTGIYARQGVEQSLYNTYSTYSNHISVHVEIYTSSNVNGEYQYCTMVSVANRAGDPLRVYFSLLPVAQGTGGLSVDSSIIATPVDYTNPGQPARQLYAWIANDIDGDGIVELLNNTNSVEFENIMSCKDLYNLYESGELWGLPLPPDADVRGLGYYASEIDTSINGPSLLDAARSSVGGLPDDMAVPFWGITIQPLQKVNLYFFINSPQDPGVLSIVVAFKNPVNGNLLIFDVETIK